MLRIDTPPVRTFHRLTNPGDTAIAYGYTVPNVGVTMEVVMRWYTLGGDTYPRLECYSDAFSVLASLHDVTDALALWHNRNLTPEDFIALLTSCGFTESEG